MILNKLNFVFTMQASLVPLHDLFVGIIGEKPGIGPENVEPI